MTVEEGLEADPRGRRIVLVSHCLLNANSKVEGLAPFVGVHPLIVRLADAGAGVVQLPCPELAVCGMSRPGQSREQLDHPAFREHCARLAADAQRQVAEYQRCGYRILGMVGVEGSPSCGVARVDESDGSGLLIEALREQLTPLGVPIVAIDESQAGNRVEEVMAALLEQASAGPPVSLS